MDKWLNEKRKLDEYLEQNPSISNKSTDDLIANQSANWLREGILIPIGNNHSSKNLPIINDENVGHSSSAQQISSNNIVIKQQSEQNQIYNIQPIAIWDFSNPKADDYDYTQQSNIESSLVKIHKTGEKFILTYN